MRPLLALVLLTFLAAPLAWAGEPSAEDAEAARAGRLLVSSDPDRRAEGEALLLARIEAGGDVEHYVRVMSTAISDWANRDERLLEVWIERAVSGDAEERDRAVRLIHALGESAVRRLVVELRHARASTGVELPETSQPEGEDAQRAAQASDETVDVAPPHTPRVYDTTELAKEMNPLEIKGFLERTADASRVASLGGQYVVFASPDGHAALVLAIEQREAGFRQQKAAPDEGAATARDAPSAPKPPAPAGDGSKNDDGGDQQDEDELPPREASLDALLPAGPRFEVHPILVRVPADASLAGYLESWDGASDKDVLALLGPNVKNTPTTPFVGDLADVEAWRSAAPRLPDARTTQGVPMTVVAGHEANAFVGEALQYRRNLRREKGGGWGVEQATLNTGLDLTVTLTLKDDGIEVAVRARMSDVSKPLATTEQTPEKGADPVELDVVEWNRQSRRVRFMLPDTGGGAVLAMPDPTRAEDGLVLIVLTIKPAPAKADADSRQQFANGAPVIPAGGARGG